MIDKKEVVLYCSIKKTALRLLFLSLSLKSVFLSSHPFDSQFSVYVNTFNSLLLVKKSVDGLRMAVMDLASSS